MKSFGQTSHGNAWTVHLSWTQLESESESELELESELESSFLDFFDFFLPFLDFFLPFFDFFFCFLAGGGGSTNLRFLEARREKNLVIDCGNIIYHNGFLVKKCCDWTGISIWLKRYFTKNDLDKGNFGSMKWMKYLCTHFQRWNVIKNGTSQNSAASLFQMSFITI